VIEETREISLRPDRLPELTIPWLKGYEDPFRFAKMDRAEFERRTRDLVGPQGRLAMLRTIVAEAGAP